MNDIVIFSRGIANKLLDKNFKLKQIGKDKRNKDASVFYFEDTSELRMYLKDEFNIIIE